MNMHPICTLTPAGWLAFDAFRDEYAIVKDVADRIPAARKIMANPNLCQPVPGCGEIDLDARFDTGLDFARHVYPALISNGQGQLSDPGTIMFLYLAYVDQLWRDVARVISSYKLDDKSSDSSGMRRNSRNTAFAYLTLYHFHQDDERVCKALLSGKPYEMQASVERIAQNPKVMNSRGMMELVIAMFLDQNTGRFKKKPAPSKRSGANPKKAYDAMREMTVVVFDQLAKNYNVSLMSAREIFAITPDTRGLAPFKLHAQKWFADGGEQPSSSTKKTKR